MEQDIKIISIEKIRNSVPTMIGIDNELLIDDTEYGATKVAHPIYRHPLRLDGILLSIRLKGTSKLNINLKEHTIKPNDVYICATGDLIQSGQTEGHHQSMLVMISNNFIKDMYMTLKNTLPYFSQKESPVVHLTDEEVDMMRDYFLFLKKSVDGDDFFKLDTVRRILAAYLYKLGSVLYRHRPELKEPTVQPMKREEVVFKHFIDYLTQYHQTERRVDFYAEKLCLSPKHFSTVIKKVSGETAGHWIDEYVVLEAKTLLKYSTMSVQEISYFLNFPNPSFFGKYFRHHTGYSPSEYRSKP